MTLANSVVVEAYFAGRRARSRSMTSTGDKLYSYGTVIRQRLDDGTEIANVTRYSVTTTIHQSQARYWSADFKVGNVPIGEDDLVYYLAKAEGWLNGYRRYGYRGRGSLSNNNNNIGGGTNVLDN